MNNQWWSLQEAMDNPSVEAFVYAECSGKKLSAEIIAKDMYRCAVGDVILTSSSEKRPIIEVESELAYAGEECFSLVKDVEDAIQKQVPDYEIGSRIWHDGWVG